jgi:hypothetical protein
MSLPGFLLLDSLPSFAVSLFILQLMLWVIIYSQKYRPMSLLPGDEL